MGILEGLNAVKASVELTKILSDRLNRPEIDVADVRAKVHETLIHMVNAQVALAEAESENQRLLRALDDRDRLNAITDDLDFSEADGFFVRKSEQEPGAFIPYCPRYWDANKNLVHLSKGMQKGTYLCPVDQSNYTTAESRQERNDRIENAKARTRRYRITPWS